MLTIKRRVSVSQDVEQVFDVRDLVEQFTDEQLREAGLYRDLRDADIAREKENQRLYREEMARHQSVCDDDDCDCAWHSSTYVSAGQSFGDSDALHERDWWPLVRALAIRRDHDGLMHELESRCRDRSDAFIDLSSAFGAKR